MERILYRLENAFIAVLALYLFLIYGTTWTVFLIFLALPKLIYLIPSTWYEGTRYKAIYDILHSLLHSYSIVFIVALVVFLFENILLWSILGWFIHIAVDRVIK